MIEKKSKTVNIPVVDESKTIIDGILQGRFADEQVASDSDVLKRLLQEARKGLNDKERERVIAWLTAFSHRVRAGVKEEEAKESMRGGTYAVAYSNLLLVLEIREALDAQTPDGIKRGERLDHKDILAVVARINEIVRKTYISDDGEVGRSVLRKEYKQHAKARRLRILGKSSIVALLAKYDYTGAFGRMVMNLEKKLLAEKKGVDERQENSDDEVDPPEKKDQIIVQVLPKSKEVESDDGAKKAFQVYLKKMGIRALSNEIDQDMIDIELSDSRNTITRFIASGSADKNSLDKRSIAIVLKSATSNTNEDEKKADNELLLELAKQIESINTDAN